MAGGQVYEDITISLFLRLPDQRYVAWAFFLAPNVVGGGGGGERDSTPIPLELR